MILKDVRIGNQRLLLGDCLAVMPMLGRFDAVVTDPPFGINYAANPIVGKGKKASNHARKDWDGAVPDMATILQFASHHIIWGGNYFQLPPVRGWLTWFKPDAPPSLGQFEMAWTNIDRTTRQISQSIAATNAERVGHPTQKPLAVMEWCLGFLPDAKTILDPFMGSGTTLVACQRMGRHGTGIELDPDYFDIACRRVDEAARQPDLLIPETRQAPVQEGTRPMTRATLPNRRPNITLSVEWQGHDMAVTIGFDPATGQPSEVFVNTAKGGDMQAALADASVVLSVALQHGISPAELGKSLGRVPVWGEEGKTGPASPLGAIVAAIMAEVRP